MARAHEEDEISGTGDDQRTADQGTQVSWSTVGPGGEAQGVPQYPNLRPKVRPVSGRVSAAACLFCINQSGKQRTRF